ncbi:hypothetical protein AJ80_05646 [Polytolypa hystricis UAMH7299]|uniref:RNA ligase/cyclic nucleotide phosphodiesterase n=1 Tax=Polytolypa hystricis (strain UAMH7299) TaxID=1447883 RepID=A0A2B7Y0Z3_POLH7|nr:hypothetical protein AJ80_05646 [Polytolypa hystricis UAMH7299]
MAQDKLDTPAIRQPTAPRWEENPFEPVISACNSDPGQIQAANDTHRSTRNAQQRAKILNSGFRGWDIDPILAKLESPERDPEFIDPRNCLVIWARPPALVQQLVEKVQQEIREVAPSIWFMPLDNLHMTTLELTHSRTKQEIEDIVATLGEGVLDIVNYTVSHRARLIKPMLSYDSAGFALSFVPVAGENVWSDDTEGGVNHKYTYHHLRGDIFAMAKALGADVAPRYTAPSAHLTIGRFITQEGFTQRRDGNNELEAVPDRLHIKRFIDKVEEINAWLEAEYWPRRDGGGGDWIVGEEKGLDYQKGTLWYGNGERIMLGKGFNRYN